MAGGPDSAVSAENSATSPSWADPGRAGRLPIGRWEKRTLIGGGGGTADLLSRGRDGEAGGPSEALRSHGASGPAPGTGRDSRWGPESGGTGLSWPSTVPLPYCLEEVILKFTLCFSCRLVGERFGENLMGKFKGRPANL